MAEKESEYEDKIGELQEKVSECCDLTREIYNMLGNCEGNSNTLKMRVLEGIMGDLSNSSQKVGWIDTRKVE